ncbi:hypothetical protein [Nocardia seriolae]|uniref:Secreted protein n=1 Tax=Nocardia seriolae TaxID=37332 RepID=A0ABC8AXF1_9NOCA|nr:hypothetical protein [Nocardia seriolae]APA99135.1 hypothetical protein NS506_05089 [Nocardia seriolae]MTJ63459.1 hypothetical protein [Nocardia seriolae]MTJ73779.1 hypothetical protein [Nocardia seriolae]MTJ88740.1 hypothetical protein [Nocardia seriolae]MTK32720.1 hypothetical protein [Nocardia seriolae]
MCESLGARLIRATVLTGIGCALLAPGIAAADTDLPEGLHCDVLDCSNDTDRDYVVSGHIQCEYTDPDGGGSSGSEQFIDIVPAHSRYRLSGCIDGQAPFLRSIEDVE